MDDDELDEELDQLVDRHRVSHIASNNQYTPGDEFNLFHNGHRDEDEVDVGGEEEGECEDDEEDYLRLDTIVEEDEDDASNCNHVNNQQTCDTPSVNKQYQASAAHRPTDRYTNNNGVARPLTENRSAVDDTDISTNSLPSYNNRSLRKFTLNGSPSDAPTPASAATTTTMNNNNNKSTSSSASNQATSIGTLIPSTNRLISEHQARNQQQALFRALAERQKLTDELISNEQQQPESNASQNAYLSDRAGTVPSRGARSRRRASQSAAGVPLSSVDLSSMSDRMLDDLLGHIASASSSSLSSNGGSLDSSDLSTDDDDDDNHGHNRPDQPICDRRNSTERAEEDDDSNGKTTSRLTANGGGVSVLNGRLVDAPNVVGVHEDANCMARAQRRPLNCRTAHRKANGTCDSDDHDEEDDDENEHELVVHLAGGDQICSLSPSAHTSESLMRSLVHGSGTDYSGSSEPAASVSCRTEATHPAATGQSVENVLRQMLLALNEVAREREHQTSTMDGKQEQLNELLERGFSHLEQLLNLPLESPSSQSTSPGSSASNINLHQRSHQQWPAHSTVQKLISTSSATSNHYTLSKDSDYGSDTQSADCFSHTTEHGGTIGASGSGPANPIDHQPQSGASPTRTSASPVQQAPPSVAAALSPAAIELSGRLFESITRLAQQQQLQQQQLQQRQQETPKPTSPNKRAPMKSVVMINATRSPSVASNVSNSSTTSSSTAQQLILTGEGASQTAAAKSASNLTPTGEQQRQPFKTCVSIGGQTNEVSQCLVMAGSSGSNSQMLDNNNKQASVTTLTMATGKAQAKLIPDCKQEQTAGNFERRRSARSSLRRRPSFTGSINGSQHPRPGSPVPRSYLSGAEPISQAEDKKMAEQLYKSKKAAEDEQEQEDERNRSYKRLQRALTYGQKYNYSPTKLAYSKLGAHLQLTQALEKSDLAAAASEQIHAMDGNKNGANLPLGAIQVSGQVELDISYFAKSGSLTVHILQCAQLAPVSKRRTTSNPYVKLYLLPDRTKSGKRKSSVKRGQLDPKFDERFTFGPLQLVEFDGKTLWLSVWHKDRLGRNEFLGEILLPLAQVRQQLLSSDLCQSTSARWYQLKDRFIDGLPSSTQGDGTLRGATLRAKQPLIDSQAAVAKSKLDEFKQRAARLTSVAAAPPHLAELPSSMNVKLGPTPEASAPITGQLFVALKFVPDRTSGTRSEKNNREGQLHVLIKEAHDIAGFEAPSLAPSLNNANIKEQLTLASGSLPNPFCKCYLLSSTGQRLAKQKTPILKRTSNPRWDHKCQFQSVRLANLHSQAIEIQLFNRDSILVSHSNEYLGGIRLCRSPWSTQQQQQQATTSSAQQANASDSISLASSTNTNDSSSLSMMDGSGDGATTNFARNKSLEHHKQEHDNSILCNERESRLWSQMLAKPNIWVYGELRLRQLQPLIAVTSNANEATTA